MNIDRQHVVALRHCALPQKPEDRYGELHIGTLTRLIKSTPVIDLGAEYKSDYRYRKVSIYNGDTKQWFQTYLIFTWRDNPHDNA